MVEQTGPLHIACRRDQPGGRHLPAGVGERKDRLGGEINVAGHGLVISGQWLVVNVSMLW